MTNFYLLGGQKAQRPRNLSNVALMQMGSAKFNFSAARIAVLEPSAFSFQITRGVLAGFGFRQIAGYQRAAEAVRRLATAPADILLCEPFPHYAESLAALRTLREPRFGDMAHAPFIIVTANVTMEVLRAAKECKVDYIVAKPFAPKTLLERIIWSAKTGEFRDTQPALAIPKQVDNNEVVLW